MDESPSAASSRRGRSRRVSFPAERKLVLDTLRLGRGKPMMHGFVELDVTRARHALRAHRERSGESVSFTAFVLASLGRAVAAHPEVHAQRDWFGRLVMFEDVDATTIIEVLVDGRPFPLGHVVRAINRRSVRDIHEEIRRVQTSGVRSLPALVRVASKVLLIVPGFVRRTIFRALLRFPGLAKLHIGTMLVTAVGMFSDAGAGWGVSAPGLHNFAVLVGAIVSREAATPDADGSKSREMLCLTVSANHELMDGAPVARFTRDLARIVDAAELLESIGSEHVSL